MKHLRRKPLRTDFPRVLWHWTNVDESLYDLEWSELLIFELLVKEAGK